MLPDVYFHHGEVTSFLKFLSMREVRPMAKLAIWIVLAPLALLVFLWVWRDLAEIPSRLATESADGAMGAG